MKLHRIVMMALLAAAMPATAPGAGEECGARIPQSLIDWELQRLASGKTYEDLAGPPPLAGVVDLIPVKVHIVNRSNGTGGLTIAQVDTSIQQLNARFAQVGWTFVRMGTVDVINSDRFFNLADTLQSECDALRQVNPAPLMVNIYFTNMPTLNGLSSFSGEAVQGIILSNNAALNGSTFAHEMGHYFDLYHTHENVFGYECPSGVNCLIAGDLLCDTPADPNLFGRVRDTDCVFFHVVQPPSACLPIMPYNPSTDLLMSYAPPRCRTRFSAQQMTKMRFVRNTIRTYLRMPLYAWISDNDGLWGNPANWALGAVPQADDTATVFLPGTYTITVSDRRTVGGLRFTAEGGAQTLLVRAPGNFLSVRGKSRINRNGRIRVESGSLITGDTVTVEGGLSLEGGTLIPGGVLRLLGTGGVEHSWTAGVVSQQSSAGVVMLDSGSVWNLDGPLAKTINTGKVLNNARLVWRGGNIELPWAGELRNLSGGTIECYVDSSIRTPAGTGGGSSFNNAGLFVKRGGAGTTGIGGSLNITSNTNSGTIRAETGRILFTYIGEGTGTYFAAPGAMIDFTTGGAPGVQYTFNGASFLGGGICRLFSGPFLLRGRIRADSLLLHGGTYYDSCRFAGTVVWRGGVQNGFARWNVDTTGTLRFAGNGELRIEGAIVNDGLLIWDDSATIATYLGGGITNRSRGRFDIRSNAFLTAPFGTGSLLNDGLIHKTAGTGLTVLGGLQNVITLTNNGTIRASSGSLRLTKSGEGRGRFEADAGATLDLAANPFTLRAGATFAGAGRKRLIGGTLELDGTVHAGGLELLAGTLTGTGRFTGAASWTGSTFADRLMLTIDTTGTLDIDSATTKVNWGVVNNSGLMRLLRRCTVELRFGGTLRTLPGGVFEARADGLIHCPSGQSGGHWDNQGLFVKNGGTDTTAIGGIGQIVYTINSGLVEVRSGTLAFGSNYRQTAGRLLVNGGTVASTAGTLLAIDGGELAGTGRVTGRVGISQAGVVSPGIPGFGAASPAGEGGGAESPVLLPGIGRLEFTGPFTQSGPQTRWEMEIAGPDTLSHDRVVVAGGASLDGTLNIRMVGSYIPDTVHVHQLAAFGSRTGTFAGVTGPGSEFGFSFMPVYGTSGAGVRRAGPLSLPQTPVPVSPRDSALIAADSSTVRWRVTLPGVTRYWVEWATNAGFSPKSVDSMVTDTARVLRGFALGQRVWWRVRGYNATGWGPVSAAWSFVRVATGVDPKEPVTEETPTVHTLAQNYPNPFNPSTTIRFGLPQAERVSLTVYDAVGREIARLAEGGYPAGAHSVVFDAKGLSSGIYFYRMTAGSFTEVRKLILIK